MLNKFFNFYSQNKTNPEQELVSGFATESIQMYGLDVIYLQRKFQKLDDIFGEDVLSHFGQYWTIEMAIENVEWWEGQGDILSPMGNIFKDQVFLVVSQSRFKEVTGLQYPLEGDLIYFPKALNKGLFEIKYADKERQFYPLGVKPTFKLRCQLFDLSGEQFSTGLSDIDNAIQARNRPQSLQDLEDIGGSNLSISDESKQDLATDEENPWGDF